MDNAATVNDKQASRVPIEQNLKLIIVLPIGAVLLHRTNAGK